MDKWHKHTTVLLLAKYTKIRAGPYAHSTTGQPLPLWNWNQSQLQELTEDECLTAEQRHLTSSPSFFAYSISSSKRVSMWSVVKVIGTRRRFFLLCSLTKPLMASWVRGPSHGNGPTWYKAKHSNQCSSYSIQIQTSRNCPHSWNPSTQTTYVLPQHTPPDILIFQSVSKLNSLQVIWTCDQVSDQGLLMITSSVQSNRFYSV